MSQLRQALRSTEIRDTVPAPQLSEAAAFPEVWDAVPVSQLCQALRWTEIVDTVPASGLCEAVDCPEAWEAVPVSQLWTQLSEAVDYPGNMGRLFGFPTLRSRSYGVPTLLCSSMPRNMGQSSGFLTL